MANKVMIKDWETPIPFGWRLATTDEMKRLAPTNEMKSSLNSVRGEMERKGQKKIFLSNGSWHLEDKTARPRHEMKVLLFLMEAPKFKILHRKKDCTEIGKVGWRFACVNEVKPYLGTVKAMIKDGDFKIARLSDGWVDGEGKYSQEEKHGIDYALLIETPVNAGKAASAHLARTSGGNASTNNAGGSSSAKRETGSKMKAAEESGKTAK